MFERSSSHSFISLNFFLSFFLENYRNKKIQEIPKNFLMRRILSTLSHQRAMDFSISHRAIPPYYEGLWRRRIIRRSNGISDNTTSVWWFQSESFHIDLRIPVNATPQQKTGFAGVTLFKEESEDNEGKGLKQILTWHPEIAFPAISDEVDSGYMEFLKKNKTEVKEIGIDGTYEEEWYREENGTMSSTRLVEKDSGLVLYSIEGSHWKAIAKGKPTFSYIDNENDKSKWTEIAVYHRSSGDSSEWDLKGSTLL
jgi:hypothetical protein